MSKRRIAAAVGVGLALLGAGILAAFAAAGPAGPFATTGTVTTVPSMPTATTVGTTTAATTSVPTTTAATTTVVTTTVVVAPPRSRLSTADRRFVSRASGSGRLELSTARSALLRSYDPALRSFARRLVAAHTRSSARLRAITRPFGLRLALSLTFAQQRQLAALRRASSARFARSFARLQVKLHRQAIALYGREVALGTNRQLRVFARSTLPMLRAHLVTARRLAATA
jgi:putative membrane protein